MEFDFQLSVLTGTPPTTKELVRARRTRKEWQERRARYLRLCESARQLAFAEPQSVQATLCRNFLVSSASKELHDEAAKLQAKISEIRDHLPTLRHDRELADQEATCMSLATDHSWHVTETMYARALDRLEELQRREAMRSETAEANARARLAEMTTKLIAVHARMLIPENMEMGSPAKANTVC